MFKEIEAKQYFELYKKGVELTQNGEYIMALKILNSLFGVSTAFSTKHIHFWSKAKKKFV